MSVPDPNLQDVVISGSELAKRLCHASGANRTLCSKEPRMFQVNKEAAL
jgi:hypothetical protein